MRLGSARFQAVACGIPWVRTLQRSASCSRGVRFARNSTWSRHVPSGSSRSPRQRHQFSVISPNVQRIVVPSGNLPSCTMSLARWRPISSARIPSCGLNQFTHQAWMEGSWMRIVVPYQLANLGDSGRRSERRAD